ncbi:MAG: ABC transporter permease [Eubacteriales bacterium]|nr:ABC transporter permease [Eubacteriales bacterium]
MNGKKQEQYSNSSYWRDSLLRFKKHKLAMVGLVTLVLMVLLVIFAPLIFQLDPISSDYENFGVSPNARYWLGTDDLGRDAMARLLFGGRVSLHVGLTSSLLSLLIGCPLGVIAGFYKGVWEQIIMRASEVFMSIPSMILALVMVSITGPSMRTVIIVIGIMGWPEFAKLMYATTLSNREKDYIESARAIGTNSKNIILKYILPNSLSPLIVAFTFRTASSIIQESSLSFLGMGVMPPQASWGNILYDAQSISILSDRPWLWIPAGICLVLIISSLNFIGDGLRDALDTKTVV